MLTRELNYYVQTKLLSPDQMECATQIRFHLIHMGKSVEIS